MPESFDRCVENGGRVRTISGPNKKYGLKKGEYRKICFIDNSAFMGHKTKKKSEKGKKR